MHQENQSVAKVTFQSAGDRHMAKRPRLYLVSKS